MARWVEPTPEQVTAWRSWLAEEAIQTALDPWTYYHHGGLGRRVQVIGFTPNALVKVIVRGDWNRIPFEAEFWCPPGDLTECDGPAPNEPVGVLTCNTVEINKLLTVARAAIERGRQWRRENAARTQQGEADPPG